ncbi:pseudouridine synthase [Nonomuraea purpurea]|uniref:Pseudouridine synthase n=1 Tax=Nonomuraea purpurea TaxID=1849276 RepID=A0ABV8G2X8_9ACTN
MINRRSTPSGDGRGRGRTGGSGRGGRPAFRSDDRRDGGFRSRSDREDSRGRSERGESRDGGSRSGGFRGDSRTGGSSRSDSRGGGPRSDSRGESRGGFRGESRGESRGGFRGESRGESRGGFRGDSRGESRGGGFRGDSRRTDTRRDGGYGRDGGTGRDGRDDRGRDRDRDRGFGRDSASRGPARDSLRADRGGTRARYGGGRDGDREARYPRAGGARDERYSRDQRDTRDDRYTRDDRPRGDRDDRPRGDRYASEGRYQRDDRAPRTERQERPRGGREERYERPRGDRGGYRSDRREDRGGYDRGGSGRSGSDRGDFARGGSGYERRDDRPRFRDDRPGFRADRSGRREDTTSGAESTTRSRYGRRGDDAPRRDGAQARSRAPRRDDVQTVGGGRRESYGSPQHDRVKAARQPLRDRDFYSDDYTDERDTTEVPNGVRLQKVLAQAGVASRRACEEMIGDGRVTVNGQVVRRFGAKVDPATQVIHVDGKRIPTAPDLVYYALNKPIGVVSTMDDPQGRPCLADFVEELAPRLFHVGRLDTETEGLLLLTNDGELANRLTHPSYGVQKKYWAKVPGPIPRDLGRRLKQGIELEDGLAKADGFSIVQEHGQQALVEVVLHEGRKHIVRRMLEESGHRVIDLARIEFGPVKLGRTKPGTVRALTLKEVGDLYAAVKL